MHEADGRDDVDVLILTGADPAFCAGLDLKELGSSGGNLGGGSGSDGSRNTTGARGPFPKLTKPLIGAINGVAITGGFELALNCDFLIASEHAKFGDTHTRVGVMPGLGPHGPAAAGDRRAAGPRDELHRELHVAPRRRSSSGSSTTSSPTPT